ncbi:MAG TPA: copper resistance CopC family protein, partial [Thermomicrobiales bacterium]|nr:copper resistance CopC family protein [Thermomicrobiales bacterium]
MKIPAPPLPRYLLPLVFLLALLASAALVLPMDARAHATLVEADPPVDGLVLASPGAIRLTFSEEVRATNPAPSITIQDESGRSRAMSDQPVGPFDDDGRVLTLNVLPLDSGTYTVTWNVTSAVDGHELSGSYAFRVGGGLPPGIATTEEDTPAPWAVATRWISFLGAAIAAGMFLFDQAILGGVGSLTRWPSRRSLLILGGSVLALLATIAEPVLQVLLDDRGGAVNLGNAVRGLPEGWWWRPAMLFPLAVLAGVLALSRRVRIPPPFGWL